MYLRQKAIAPRDKVWVEQEVRQWTLNEGQAGQERGDVTAQIKGDGISGEGRLAEIKKTRGYG